MTALERLMAKTVERDDCWVWTGTVDGDGYGRANEGAKAHRAVYELIVGPIADGMELDHLCRVRACVRPSHLEPVTHAENVRRGGSFAAVNAAKESCTNGHEFTTENTYLRPNGKGRDCRTCIRIRVRRYKARRDAA